MHCPPTLRPCLRPGCPRSPSDAASGSATLTPPGMTRARCSARRNPGMCPRPLRRWQVDRDQSIERPPVKVWPAVKRQTLRKGGQPGEGTEVDIGVVADDVGVGMVVHTVLPIPD